MPNGAKTLLQEAVGQRKQKLCMIHEPFKKGTQPSEDAVAAAAAAVSNLEDTREQGAPSYVSKNAHVLWWCSNLRK